MRGLIVSALLLFSVTLCFGTAFTGPAQLIFVDQSGAFGSSDTTGLQIVNTSDGFKITGTLSGSFPPSDTGGWNGTEFLILGSRILAEPDGVPVTAFAHLTLTITTVGDLIIRGVNNRTLLTPGYPNLSCAASLIDVGIFNSGGLSGFVDAGSATSTQPCPAYSGFTVLSQVFEAEFLSTQGLAGSFVISFGNSSGSDALVPSQVPEPATFGTVGLVLVCAVIRGLKRGGILRRYSHLTGCNLITRLAWNAAICGLSAAFCAAQTSTVLIDAVRSGDAPRVSALLAKGADSNERGPQRITPLLVAASMGRVDIAKVLLAKKAAVNVQDTSSWQLSPLMVASFSGRLEMMKLLLDNGADIELRNKDGNTALFFASQAKDEKPGVNLLLERGARKLPPKSGLAAFLEVGGLPLNSKCFEHIEGPRCSNASAKRTK